MISFVFGFWLINEFKKYIWTANERINKWITVNLFARFNYVELRK